MKKVSEADKLCVRGRACIVALATVLLSLGSHAQLLKYDSEDELLGAAASSPGGVQQILERLVATCSAYGPALQSSGQQALIAWQARHGAYLEESAAIRRELQARYAAPKSDPRVREAFKNSLEVARPKMIDAQYESFVAPIKALQSSSQKAAICRSYIQSIADKKWDLKSNDPTLATYFDRRIGANRR